MPGTKESGIPGVRLPPGGHSCALFIDERQRNQVLAPYIRHGLRGGDVCVLAVNSDNPAPLLASIGDAHELAAWEASGQLDVRPPAVERCSTPGLTLEQMLGMWSEIIAIATSPGGSARVGGEAAWWLRVAAEGTLISYESEMNRFIPPRLWVLCMYDLCRFGGGLLADAVRTHPIVLVGGRQFENPYYLTPDQFLGIRTGAATPGSPDEEILGWIDDIGPGGSGPGG